MSQLSKSDIRKRTKLYYKEMPPAQRTQISSQVAQSLYRRLTSLVPRTRVGLFLSMWDEIDTFALVEQLYAEQRLTILVPRVEGEIMHFYSYDPAQLNTLSQFGIVEPSQDPSEAQIPEVIIVPGIAFDVYGNRVGRGKGFYDKFFAKYSALIRRKIAITTEYQLLEAVPAEAHDVLMDEIITEARHLVFTTNND